MIYRHIMYFILIKLKKKQVNIFFSQIIKTSIENHFYHQFYIQLLALSIIIFHLENYFANKSSTKINDVIVT